MWPTIKYCVLCIRWLSGLSASTRNPGPDVARSTSLFRNTSITTRTSITIITIITTTRKHDVITTGNDVITTGNDVITTGNDVITSPLSENMTSSQQRVTSSFLNVLLFTDRKCSENNFDVRHFQLITICFVFHKKLHTREKETDLICTIKKVFWSQFQIHDLIDWPLQIWVSSKCWDILVNLSTKRTCILFWAAILVWFER